MGAMPHPEVSRTTEDYLTLVWKAYEWPDSRPTTSDLAAALGVTKSTVSANLKKLARDGFIAYEPYGAIELTDAGRAIAIDIVRRHRIIETYLVQRLDLGWDEVHDEADALEHSVSDLVLERMDAALGHPDVDPHGDPIPRDGVTPPLTRPLGELAAGAVATVARISDRHPDVLRYLHGKGVVPGARLAVLEPAGAAGSARVEVGGAATELSLAAVDAVRVRA